MAVRPLMVLPPVIFAGLVGAFLGGMYWTDDELPSALVGQAAPATAVEPLRGFEPFDPAALADGRVKLVNFWASWCAPCRVEHPNLQALADEGVPILGINYKDDPEAALAFLAELGSPYEALAADSSGRVARDWGVYGVPETFVLDGEGRVVLRVAGPVTTGTSRDRLLPALEAARTGG